MRARCWAIRYSLTVRALDFWTHISIHTISTTESWTANVATKSTRKPETSISETIELKRSSWIKYRLQPAVSEQSSQTDLNNCFTLLQEESNRIAVPKAPTRERPESVFRKSTRIRKPADRYGQWIMNGLN
jgi:hypothetical protein